MPTGWRAETFAFPLEFAPSIQRRGEEQLRFPPGFMDAASPNFWSYAFTWWLDDDRPLDAATLAAELQIYFDGLAKDVDAERHKLPATAGGVPSRAHLADTSEARVSGDITIWDAFTTGAQVTLHVKVAVVRCGKRRAAIFALSPADAAAPIWKDLDAVVASGGCVTPRS